MRSGIWRLFLIAAAAMMAFSPAWATDKSASHKSTQSASYIPLAPIYTTVMEDGRPIGLLLVSMGLDIADPALHARVTATLPILRDALVRNLMAYTIAAVRPNEPPDVDEIARRLQAVTDQVLQDKGAKVLLGQVVLRITR